MTAAVFDPRTSYARDYRRMDFVDQVTFEPDNGDLLSTDPDWRAPNDTLYVRWGHETASDLIRLAESIGLTSANHLGVLWNPDTENEITLRIGDTIRGDDQVGWMIRSFGVLSTGPWLIDATKERTNVEPA